MSYIFMMPDNETIIKAELRENIVWFEGIIEARVRNARQWGIIEARVRNARQLGELRIEN